MGFAPAWTISKRFLPFPAIATPPGDRHSPDSRSVDRRESDPTTHAPGVLPNSLPTRETRRPLINKIVNPAQFLPAPAVDRPQAGTDSAQRPNRRSS
jgi:hypothetical protein